MDASYIPIAEARGFTTHWIKIAARAIHSARSITFKPDSYSHTQYGGYNPWTLNKDDNKKIKHWMVMPEFRYWLCERFNGHFFGIHTGFAEYNISGVRIPFQNKSTQEHRYEGWATGIGISYGYTWILGKRWNLEANIGAGYIYTKYDKYECKTCGRFKGNQKKHYFGPTKAGISLIYIIK